MQAASQSFEVSLSAAERGSRLTAEEPFASSIASVEDLPLPFDAAATEGQPLTRGMLTHLWKHFVDCSWCRAPQCAHRAVRWALRDKLWVSDATLAPGEKVFLLILLGGLFGVFVGAGVQSVTRLLHAFDKPTVFLQTQEVGVVESARVLFLRPLPAAAVDSSPDCFVPQGGAVPLVEVVTTASEVEGTGQQWPFLEAASQPLPVAVCNDTHSELRVEPEDAAMPPGLVVTSCWSVRCVATAGAFVPFGWRANRTTKAQLCEVQVGPISKSSVVQLYAYVPYAWNRSAAADGARLCSVGHIRYFHGDAAEVPGDPDRTALVHFGMGMRDEDDDMDLQEFADSPKLYDWYKRSTVSTSLGCATTGGGPWRWRWDGPMKWFVTYQHYLPGDPISQLFSFSYSFWMDATRSTLAILGLSQVASKRHGRFVLQGTGDGGTHPSCIRAFASSLQIECPASDQRCRQYLPDGDRWYAMDSAQLSAQISGSGLSEVQVQHRSVSYTILDLAAGMVAVMGGALSVLNFCFPMLVGGRAGRYWFYGARRWDHQSRVE